MTRLFEQHNDSFQDYLERTKVLIDMLSDADFRSKFPDFVEKHKLLLEEILKVLPLLDSEQFTYEDTQRAYIENLLQGLEDMKPQYPPDLWSDIDGIANKLRSALDN